MFKCMKMDRATKKRREISAAGPMPAQLLKCTFWIAGAISYRPNIRPQKGANLTRTNATLAVSTALISVQRLSKDYVVFLWNENSTKQSTWTATDSKCYFDVDIMSELWLRVPEREDIAVETYRPIQTRHCAPSSRESTLNADEKSKCRRHSGATSSVLNATRLSPASHNRSLGKASYSSSNYSHRSRLAFHAQS